MARPIFFQWLQRLSDFIERTPGRRIVLLVDNASSHGRDTDIPVLHNMVVRFLPRRTTAILQPLDAGIIAIIKLRYQRRLTERGVDLVENGTTTNIHRIDLRMAIHWVYDIWARLKKIPFGTAGSRQAW